MTSSSTTSSRSNSPSSSSHRPDAGERTKAVLPPKRSASVARTSSNSALSNAAPSLSRSGRNNWTRCILGTQPPQQRHRRGRIAFLGGADEEDEHLARPRLALRRRDPRQVG